jgi:hypothetical protein
MKAWWWKPLWKLKSPLRCKLTLWLSLKNKLLTWDNGIKRGWIGPNWCVLCKSDVESNSHVFVSCPYAGKVYSMIKDNLGINSEWKSESLEECLRHWLMDRSTSLYARSA